MLNYRYRLPKVVFIFVIFQLENCPLDRKTFIVKQPDNFIINRVITQGEVSHDHDQLWYLDRLWNNQFLRLMMYYTYLLISILMYFKRMSRDRQKQLNWPRWRDLFQKVSSSGFVAKYPFQLCEVMSFKTNLCFLFYFSQGPTYFSTDYW